MDGAADAALGAWASIRGFFTPATLFLVVNLVIGTIWLTSRSHQRRRRGNGYAAHDADAQHHEQQPPFHHQENQYYDHDQNEQQYVPPPPAPAPAPLARTSSVLDRLRSIGLYRFRSGDFPPEYAAAPATDSQDVTFSPAPAGGDAHYEYERSRSEPAPVREERRRPAPSRMKKSASSEAWKAEVAPAPAARVVRAAVLEEEDEVVEYARADEFTSSNSFAQQQPLAPVQHEEEEEEHYYREEYVPPLRPAPLARAPSVLDHQENQYYDHDQNEQQYVPPPPTPAPLARTSSVLDRLRSIGLYRFRSGDFPPEYAAAPATDSRDVTFSPVPAGGDAHYEKSRSEPAPLREERRRPAPSRIKKSSSSSEAWTAEVAPAPAARVVRDAVLEEEDVVEYARADEFTGRNSFAQEQPPALQHEEEEEDEEEEHYYREEYVPPLRPAPLARAPSVLDRLRSFSLSRFRSGDLAHEQADAAVAELERNHTQKQAAHHHSRSSSEPSRELSKKGKKQLQQGTEPKKSKSSSEARKPAPEEPEAEEGGVDARADDFINSFRKQLNLQRLNSLLNYKEMLNRGA